MLVKILQTYEQIQELIKNHGSPLLVTDLASIENQYLNLKQALSNVRIYYAMKANSNKTIIEKLNDLDSGFDVATYGEIKILKSLGIKNTKNKIIHTHPIKTNYAVNVACIYGINQFIVDNEEEIIKLKRHKKRINVFIRVAFSSDKSNINLSKKFGCQPEKVMNLLDLAIKCDLKINGLSFHTGSQNLSSESYVKAINICKDIFAYASLKNYPLYYLDIGGGFPIQYNESDPNIFDFCKPITEALKNLPEHVDVLCEPGRFIVAPSTYLITSVVGKSFKNNKITYYLDDGIYSSFSGKIFDHVNHEFEIMPEYRNRKYHESVLYGPTCDSIDVISENYWLPELNIGDFLLVKNMGAYCSATSSNNFNGISPTRNIFVDSYNE